MRLPATFGLALSLLTGCATGGMKYAELKPQLPSLDQDRGRIWFMRKSSMLGAAVQPDIFLDGHVVGKSQPGGFFYVDRRAGSHEASATTEARKSLAFTLEPRETKYIRSSPSMGILVGRVNFELVDAAEAEKELQELSYTGGPPTQQPPAEQTAENEGAVADTSAAVKPAQSSDETKPPEPKKKVERKKNTGMGGSFAEMKPAWQQDEEEEVEE